MSKFSRHRCHTKKKLFRIGASRRGRCALCVAVNGGSSRNLTSEEPSLLGSRHVSKWRSLNESHSGEQLAILMTHSNRHSPTPPPLLSSPGSLHGNTFSFLAFFRSVLQDELISNRHWLNKASVQIKNVAVTILSSQTACGGKKRTFWFPHGHLNCGRSL